MKAIIDSQGDLRLEGNEKMISQFCKIAGGNDIAYCGIDCPLFRIEKGVLDHADLSFCHNVTIHVRLEYQK